MHPVDAGESGLPSHGGGSLPGADTTVIIEGGAFCPGDIDTLYKAGGVLPPVEGLASLARESTLEQRRNQPALHIAGKESICSTPRSHKSRRH